MDTTALQIIFITVDPERDTPDQLKRYFSLFDVNVTGLTGSPEKVRSVLKQFGIYAEKSSQGDGDNLYDHTAAVFLYRDDGNFKGTIVHNEPVTVITEKIKCFAILFNNFKYFFTITYSAKTKLSTF